MDPRKTWKISIFKGISLSLKVVLWFTASAVVAVVIVYAVNARQSDGDEGVATEQVNEEIFQTETPSNEDQAVDQEQSASDVVQIVLNNQDDQQNDGSDEKPTTTVPVEVPTTTTTTAPVEDQQEEEDSEVPTTTTTVPVEVPTTTTTTAPVEDQQEEEDSEVPTTTTTVPVEVPTTTTTTAPVEDQQEEEDSEVPTTTTTVPVEVPTTTTTTAPVEDQQEEEDSEVLTTTTTTAPVEDQRVSLDRDFSIQDGLLAMRMKDCFFDAQTQECRYIHDGWDADKIIQAIKAWIGQDCNPDLENNFTCAGWIREDWDQRITERACPENWYYHRDDDLCHFTPQSN